MEYRVAENCKLGDILSIDGDTLAVLNAKNPPANKPYAIALRPIRAGEKVYSEGENPDIITGGFVAHKGIE